MRISPQKSLVFAFATAGLLVSCVQNSNTPLEAITTRAPATASLPAPIAATGATAAERIKTDVSWLADDARNGREAGTPGYDDAADYVAGRFASLGLKPGNDGSYLQPVNLRITKRADDAAYMALRGSDGALIEFTNKVEYLGGRSSSGAPFEVTAPLVFAGYGITGSSHDDYAGLDVNGKIVVIFNGTPSGLNGEESAHLGSGRTKSEIASANGAVGIITISANTDRPQQRWERGVGFPDNGRWGWVSPDGVANGASLNIAPTFALGPVGAAKIFENAPLSFDAVRGLVNEPDPANPVRGFDLAYSATLKGSGNIEDVVSPNVIGVIEGSDPVLKNEVVVLSAHLDHVGNHAARGGGDDTIHNGALDNAMGISTLLEAAGKFKNGDKPRRTILFIAVTAEEKGLVGSDYFAHFPTVPASSIVANVNLDMPLVLYEFTDVIAFGAERSTLGEMVMAAAAKMGIGVVPDPYPNLRLFVRSDHYNFVRQGIPSVFLFMGNGNGGEKVFNDFLSTHYHQPTDDVNLPIRWEDAARWAELNFNIASEIANGDDKPSWKEGDFFGDTFGK